MIFRMNISWKGKGVESYSLPFPTQHEITFTLRDSDADSGCHHDYELWPSTAQFSDLKKKLTYPLARKIVTKAVITDDVVIYGIIKKDKDRKGKHEK